MSNLPWLMLEMKKQADKRIGRTDERTNNKTSYNDKTSYIYGTHFWQDEHGKSDMPSTAEPSDYRNGFG